MFCKNCGKKLATKETLCNDCIEKPEQTSSNQEKKMPQWLKIILVILWVIVFSLSMQIRKQFIIGGLVGFLHVAFFLYLLSLIIKE